MKLKYVVLSLLILVSSTIFSQDIRNYPIKDSTLGGNLLTIEDTLNLELQDKYQFDYVTTVDSIIMTYVDISDNYTMTYFFKIENEFAILYKIEIIDENKEITANSNLAPDDVFFAFVLLGMMVK